MSDSKNTESYHDDTLVYVDPETKTVLGTVEWNAQGQPISKSVPKAVKTTNSTKDAHAKSWRKVYPWGTYRSMRRQFKLEGKVRDPEPQKTLDDVMDKALKEAYWER